jgi:3-hydroxybutyryl-CoA dehydrogenase
MTYEVKIKGDSRAFADRHPLIDKSTAGADVLLLVGSDTALPQDYAHYKSILIELDQECLTAHAGVDEGATNIVGFARWRLGKLLPSNLIELVTLTTTNRDTIDTARTIFQEAGFEVSLCADRLGRIVDRLIRPQFNLALISIDDGLASPADLDVCLKLGLGYRKGVLEPLLASGLEHHYSATSALFETYGLPQYAPARAAVVAHQRTQTP